VIDSLQTDVAETQVTVYLAPVSPQTKERVASLLGKSDLRADIVYVAPSSWRIPELGLIASTPSQQGGSAGELVHPTTHGNPLVFDQDLLNLVLAQAAYAVDEVHGIERLSRALNVRPVIFVGLDLAAGRITEQRDADDSQWAGIPVPTF
jgi:hypothetical protein